MDIIFHAFHGFFISVVPFVVLLGILIFVHEFGHFIVARLCGVRVETFSLGFGKKILQYKRGDTNYCVSIVPLGGYVKMYGDQPGAEVPESEKPYSFTHKKVSQRIAVVLAGPLMNFFFAIFIFFVVAIVGEEARTPRVGDINTDSKAYVSGFRSGDEILKVNDVPVRTWEEFDTKLADLHDTQAMIEVEHEFTHEKAALKVDITSKPNPNVLSLQSTVGEIEGLTTTAKATMVGVEKGSPLAALGMKTGDKILKVNNQEVNFWRDLEPLLLKQDPHQPLQLEVERTTDEESGKTETMNITLAPVGLPNYSLANLKVESAELYLGTILKKTPAEAAGLMKGDRIVQIDNKVIEKWDDVLSTVKAYGGGAGGIRVQILRDGEALNMTITPQMITQMTPGGMEEHRYTIGIAPYMNFATPEMVKVSTSNPAEALKIGVQRTWDVSVMTVMSFVRLFQAKISPKNIGGVISIGQAASETFKIGLSAFLRMMALISVNLFILNLLPIPVLDGGHLILYIIESLKGAPVSIKKVEFAQQIGLVLLMSLMVFALFNDFTRLLGL